MVKIYQCKNCHYSTLNELEFQRHLTDSEYSCKSIIIDSDDYVKKKKHYINKLISEYRELFKKLDAFRFCEVSEIDMDRVKEIYSFLNVALNRIHEKVIDLKDDISPKHLDRLSKSRNNLTNTYWHISNRYMEEELKEIHKLDDKIREYHELRRIQKFNEIKRRERHEVMKLTLENINKFQREDNDADNNFSEINSSLISTRTAYLHELRDRLRKYKSSPQDRDAFNHRHVGFDNTPISSRFDIL